MKTFEERYTEWIDGELRGPALTAFEEELARRAQAGEAQADKVGAASLRALLREHLEAPELSNTEFFNHQLREQIERGRAAERKTAPVQTPAAPRTWWSIFQLGGLATAAAAFVVAALYYGTVPQPSRDSAKVASHTPAVAAPRIEAPASEPVAPSPTRMLSPGGPVEMVKLDPPPKVDLEAHALDDSTSAIALKYKAPKSGQNVQVLWMNGLEYQQDAPAGESLTPGGNPTPDQNPAPAADGNSSPTPRAEP